MLCRVEMPTNEQIFGRFYRYKLMKGPTGQNNRTGILFIPILAALLCVFMFISGMRPLYIAVVAAAVVGYLVFALYMKPNSLFRKKGGAALQTEVTIFTDSGLNRSVKSEESGMIDSSSTQYSALYAAVETSRDFYLFTGPGQAYLIDKEYFDKGSPDDLRATLREKLGKKFTTKQK